MKPCVCLKVWTSNSSTEFLPSLPSGSAGSARPISGAEVSVRDAMRRDFQTVDPHTTLHEALALLQECQCKTIPVVHDGRLVGLLTPDNIAELLAVESALHTHARLAKREAQGRRV